MRNGRGRPIAVAAWLAVGVAPGGAAPDPLPLREYELTTLTGMPHLDENLRYAVVREKRCLSPRELSTAFRVLDHDALRGCALESHGEQGDTARYVLRCAKGNDTTGHADWQLAQNEISGTLNVRLGGKNMTFYQRVTGKVVGDCPAR